MKTKLQIEFDFEQARRRAAELEEIAENISQLSRRDIENAKADLSSAWKGESAQHFQKKTEILQEDIRGTAKELNAIAAAIRTGTRLPEDFSLRFAHSCRIVHNQDSF